MIATRPGRAAHVLSVVARALPFSTPWFATCRLQAGAARRSRTPRAHRRPRPHDEQRATDIQPSFAIMR